LSKTDTKRVNLKLISRDRIAAQLHHLGGANLWVHVAVCLSCRHLKAKTLNQPFSEKTMEIIFRVEREWYPVKL
jgi:hypothetical protein